MCFHIPTCAQHMHHFTNTKETLENRSSHESKNIYLVDAGQQSSDATSYDIEGVCGAVLVSPMFSEYDGDKEPHHVKLCIRG